MSPLAKAAKEVFHEVLRAKGRRLDQACLEDAWERVVETVLKESKKPPVKLDGSIDPPPDTSVFGKKK